ncbi:hypothetical protein J2S55_001753 [Streptosporangium brasiliense]|uniref:Uncharacterized protein n=1 Tax=Streptosporangium brasiliense TaxID=47480 RepID=A0ABT9QZW2_9ACTN|nr:hypothetical protein [Streptosporangium brasiliense]
MGTTSPPATHRVSAASGTRRVSAVACPGTRRVSAVSAARPRPVAGPGRGPGSRT